MRNYGICLYMPKKRGEKWGIDEYVCMEIGQGGAGNYELMQFTSAWSPTHNFHR